MSSDPPLLLLAEGRKPRPRKAPSTASKECKLQCECEVAAILRDHALPNWRWSHFPAGERRDVITGTRLKKFGLQPGWPHIQLISPAGLFHGLELKREGELLTGAQENFQLWAIRNGIPHSVARTFDQAVGVLDAWGCLRIRIGGVPK